MLSNKLGQSDDRGGLAEVVSLIFQQGSDSRGFGRRKRFCDNC